MTPGPTRTSRATALAVLPVRAAQLPAGAAEVVAEAGGDVLLVGAGTAAAAEDLAGVAERVRVAEVGAYAPGAWAAALAPLLEPVQLVVLPASPDGRDLAPRLAAQLDRPLLAQAMEIGDGTATTIRMGGRVLAEHPLAGPAVLTLQPGVRGVIRSDDPAPEPEHVTLDGLAEHDAGDTLDAHVVRELPPDVTTMDLSEAPRILGGGAGLDSAERFDQLERVAAAIGASMGATRVITDRSWTTHERQIGTTGVVVDPRLYLAFGISGAVQHTAGLGTPEHVVSVNTDRFCPMMELADLAVVADANATLDELEVLLAAEGSSETRTATEEAS